MLRRLTIGKTTGGFSGLATAGVNPDGRWGCRRRMKERGREGEEVVVLEVEVDSVASVKRYFPERERETDREEPGKKEKEVQIIKVI